MNNWGVEEVSEKARGNDITEGCENGRNLRKAVRNPVSGTSS